MSSLTTRPQLSKGVYKPLSTSFMVGSYWLCHQLDFLDHLILSDQIIIFCVSLFYPVTKYSALACFCFNELLVHPVNGKIKPTTIILSTKIKTFYLVKSGFSLMIIQFFQSPPKKFIMIILLSYDWYFFWLFHFR